MSVYFNFKTKKGAWKLVATTNSRKNADLIAAAPELLSALENFCDEMETNIIYNCREDQTVNEREYQRMIDEARGIIKKAKGE